MIIVLNAQNSEVSARSTPFGPSEKGYSSFMYPTTVFRLTDRVIKTIQNVQQNFGSKEKRIII